VGKEGKEREGAKGGEMVEKGEGDTTWIYVQEPQVNSYATASL